MSEWSRNLKSLKYLKLQRNCVNFEHTLSVHGLLLKYILCKTEGYYFWFIILVMKFARLCTVLATTVAS